MRTTCDGHTRKKKSDERLQTRYLSLKLGMFFQKTFKGLDFVPDTLRQLRIR